MKREDARAELEANDPRRIPRNPNSIEIGMRDPQPEKGKDGSYWRALISWLKGWGA